MYNLKKIDDELSKLREKTGVLLRQKQRVLKQMTGMNFHNDSDIEAHLNRTFSKPDEDHGQDEDIQIPEVESDDLPIGHPGDTEIEPGLVIVPFEVRCRILRNPEVKLFNGKVW
jgi:hypothetical protein